MKKMTSALTQLTVRLGRAQNGDPRRYAADRELWARKIGLQRRTPVLTAPQPHLPPTRGCHFNLRQRIDKLRKPRCHFSLRQQERSRLSA